VLDVVQFTWYNPYKMIKKTNVLRNIQNIVGKSDKESNVTERIVFCIKCGSQVFDTQPGQPIKCPNSQCGHVGTRGFIFDKDIRFSFRNDGELLHYAVGAIIKKYQADEYLLFRRRMYPEGCYTIPAGHLEKNESAEIAAVREVYEETKLVIIPSTFKLLYEDLCALYSSKHQLIEDVMSTRHTTEIEDKCRRGADYHAWLLYFCECIGDACLSYEADIMGLPSSEAKGWYKKNEIISLPELTRPTGYFLSKYFGAQLANIRKDH